MISSADILQARILIVDDQEANIRLLEDILREAGYANVTSTRGPFPVRELHRKNRYDLILLDLNMPGQDGFEVMEGLKEIETGAYLPVLVVTAQPDQKMRALKAGARDFIGKPFDLAELLFRVRNMLEARLLHAKLTGQDAPGRARAEEAQRRNEERFRLAARLLNASVWDWNLLDQSLWWSEGFLTPFGFEAGAVESSVAGWTQRIHPDDRARVMDGLRNAVAGGSESWRAEYRFRHKDGTYSAVKDHGFILRDETGKAVRVVGGLRDVSGQERTEAGHRHSDVMERFMARGPDLAGSLNNALAAMLPAIETLRGAMGEGLQGQADREALDNLFAHARRSGELTRELLSLVESFRGK